MRIKEPHGPSSGCRLQVSRLGAWPPTRHTSRTLLVLKRRFVRSFFARSLARSFVYVCACELLTTRAQKGCTLSIKQYVRERSMFVWSRLVGYPPRPVPIRLWRFRRAAVPLMGFHVTTLRGMAWTVHVRPCMNE